MGEKGFCSGSPAALFMWLLSNLSSSLIQRSALSACFEALRLAMATIELIRAAKAVRSVAKSMKEVETTVDLQISAERVVSL